MKKIRYNAVVAIETVSSLLFLLPRFTFFNDLKSFYLRTFFGASVGDNVIYYSGVRIFTGRNLRIGNDVDFAKDVIVTTDGGVSIGDRVLIGYRTQILSSNHTIPNGLQKIFNAGHTRKSVSIDEDAWIGANCIILPGATVGKGSIIAAGSVVSKEIPPFCIAGGIPARVIRERK